MRYCGCDGTRVLVRNQPVDALIDHAIARRHVGRRIAVVSGRGLHAELQGVEIVATLACGDDYFAEHEERALAALLEMLAELAAACRGRPDVLRMFLEIQMRAALMGDGLAGATRATLSRVAAALGGFGPFPGAAPTGGVSGNSSGRGGGHSAREDNCFGPALVLAL